MRKLFVMGGGGFAMEPDNLLLDKYILSLSVKKNPKICFIGTASGDSERYINQFQDAYRTLDCDYTYLSLFKPPTRDLRDFIFNQDIIHIGGGNTKNLLCLWREWKLDSILIDAYKKGIVMTGMSAGMMCWFEDSITDSFGGALEKIECLGILKGSACPHFDGEENRRPTLIKFIKDGILNGGIALDDGVGALYIDEELIECVSSSKNKNASHFSSLTAEENQLRVKFLGME